METRVFGDLVPRADWIDLRIDPFMNLKMEEGIGLFLSLNGMFGVLKTSGRNS